MSSNPDAQGEAGAQDCDVLVIGGGFAGVTAARDLSHAGFSVTLLEARDRLGGRTYYRTFADTDQKVEFGGTWVGPETPALHHIHDEIARYGIELAASPAPHAAAMHVGGQRIEGPLPVPPEQLLDLERGLHAVATASRRIDQHAPLGSQALDLDVPFSGWLAELALPRETEDVFLAFAQVYFGCSAQDVSALHVLAQVAALGYSGMAMFLVLEAKFAHGTISLINAIIDDSDAEVRLSTPVLSVAQDRGGVTVTTADGTQLRAGACVVATPLNCWDDIEFSPALSEGKRVVAQERQPGHVFKPWALVKGLPTDFFLGLGMAPHLNWISTEFKLDNGSLMCGFGPTDPSVDRTDPSQVQELIRAYAPDATVIAADHHDWDGDAYSKGTYTALRPGWLTKYGRDLRSVEGRLAFATSDIADGISLGFMSGAIQRGGAAAHEVVGILRHRHHAAVRPATDSGRASTA